MMVKHATAETSGLKLNWSDGSEQLIPWFWVRDHCTDGQSQNLKTQQRQVDTFSLAGNISAAHAAVDDSGQTIAIRWEADHETSISVRRLAQATGKCIDDEQLSSADSKIYWLKDSMPEELPSVSFDEIMTTDEGVLKWLTRIDTFGFCVVTGTEPTEAGTERLAKRIAPAQRTIFGTYWPLSTDVKHHDDTAYTTDFLSPHTDASYYHNAAGLQMFNCIEFDGKGGESVVVDGFAIARKIEAERPDLYDILCKVIVPGHYKEEGVHLAAERPVIRKNRHGELAQVTFNNYDRSPFILPEKQMAAFYEAYAEYSRHSMDQANWLKIPLRPGMALIFDNWRCMHGRMGYSGRRYFFGCYHDKADYESRLRTLQQQLGRR
ncbi:trimethyllysine dioxygenase [Aliamphritea hakodatensis]|uniref:trimethyllysine dioxygenase n=1 Tax=Aliamphritea hakodatensis TaxID=2895352 RepID=UPI0022FD5F1A|nr:trimethyllysine dioxygenase [Aliamphritea hakodatensis]